MARTECVGQLAQDAVGLASLLRFQLPDPVARLDRRRRLDEQRRAGCRGVLDDARHGAAPVSRRIGMTYRPLRTVTDMSGTCWWALQPAP